MLIEVQCKINCLFIQADGSFTPRARRGDKIFVRARTPWSLHFKRSCAPSLAFNMVKHWQLWWQMPETRELPLVSCQKACFPGLPKPADFADKSPIEPKLMGAIKSGWNWLNSKMCNFRELSTAKIRIIRQRTGLSFCWVISFNCN